MSSTIPRNRPVTISFNALDPKDCNRAVHEIADVIAEIYGDISLRRFFLRNIPTRSAIKRRRNEKLMVRYIASGLSIKQCAAKMAEENNAVNRAFQKNPEMGRFRHFRNGSYGSTNAETLERQIKREKKRMAENPKYRKFIEDVAAEWQRVGTSRNEMSRDISN